MDKAVVETMIWVRDVPASIGWVLVSPHLPIVKDIRKVILNLLYKRIEFFYPIQGVKWSSAQYQMYKSLYSVKGRQILIHLKKRQAGITFGLAGIAMSFALQGKRVCVITNSIRTNNTFVHVLDKMGKPFTSIHMYCSYSCADYDGSYDLTIIDNVDTIFRQDLDDIYKLVKERNLLLLCSSTTELSPLGIFNELVEIK